MPSPVAISHEMLRDLAVRSQYLLSGIRSFLDSVRGPTRNNTYIAASASAATAADDGDDTALCAPRRVMFNNLRSKTRK